ncbi:hypothetical protein B1C78_06475 [Thioalkalivibrio denitrificans]|uniref:DUF502 domain-containing protein n=1 Tax=Thioalkalivibrio denitrificans TaxID=108003 RepID=A0A1V3NKL8_9GAMM|nr:DUF502 domain-containing protein [Thioalkalivibrio denitrificans]OOG25605.1 hypothetical protein B1C78_06475 [Thioalkalivibrio denitrificans]
MSLAEQRPRLATLRKYLITGLVVWVPLVITFFVLKFLVDLMDNSLLLLPPAWRPQALLGFNIPGLGVVLAAVIVLLTGLITANLVGRKLVDIWESILHRIPLVRSIYSAVKQVMETLLGAGGDAFRRVLLIEYPRKGIWTVAFQTGVGVGEVQHRTSREVLTVFVPTTPNPTSGFVIMVPRDEVVELDMSVEDGLKFVMSLGVVSPKWPPPHLPESGAQVAPPQPKS